MASMSDDEMPDAPPDVVPQDSSSEVVEDNLQINGDDPLMGKIHILPGETTTAASYEFLHEDHTLGNALRYVIMKNPHVEFCGYSIPHPSDPKMNLRIQTYDDVNVHEVLQKGLSDLMDLCDAVQEKFETAKEAYSANAGA